MNLLGAGYVADYCVYRFRQKQEQKLYRAYITDALMALNNNVASYFGGTSIVSRYMDILNPQKEKDAAEIVSDVMKNAGLHFSGDDT